MVKKSLLGILGILLLMVLAFLAYYQIFIYEPPPISPEDRQAISIMPLPAKLKLEKGLLDLSQGFTIQYTGNKNELHVRAVDRLLSRWDVDGQTINNSGKIVLEINCVDDRAELNPQLRENESYDLKITKNRIRISSPGSLGILHGLETLQQLRHIKNGQYVVPCVSIQDQPRFAWRGLMIDVSRHWIPKEVILRTLDAMASVKMNVFHWHLSDDQGFRVESLVHPRLHEIGSNGHYYSQKDIREVIDYAADRGIRVIPEFDLPGHSKSWQIAYPHLATVDYPLSFGTRIGESFAPPMDPTKDTVYSFLDAFIKEMSALFPDKYFHIGGDEVNPKYWDRDSSIQQFMAANGLENGHDLQAYFNSRMHSILKKHGKVMIGWNEIFHPDLSEQVVIQSWTSHKSLFEAVQAGGSGILSTGLYLDHILPAEMYYHVDPCVLAGAVDVIPDTGFWNMYDLTMEIAGNAMESQLVLFARDPDNVTGFFAMLDNRTGFKNGSLRDGKLSFSFDGPVGKMKYAATLFADSLAGQISLGLLSFDSYGHRSGGNDVPGTSMPIIEPMAPLTEDEAIRILGGEACQWSEFVDGDNIESRIWPRTAAIAEKLWSPDVLTGDVEDMYRRLSILSDGLTERGSQHELSYRRKLNELINPEGIWILRNLTDYLQEVTYHGRMPALFEADFIYLPDFALNRPVDAVRPESMEARAFNSMVTSYLQNPEREDLSVAIKSTLEKWKSNHELLYPYIKTGEKLKDLEELSSQLSKVAVGAIRKMNGVEIKTDSLESALNFLATGDRGMIFPAAQGLRDILRSKL